MGLATDVNNIRFNGTGRGYAGEVAGASFDDLGEFEGLTFGITVTTEKMKSTRNAARATIIERESERDGAITFGLREMSENNLKMTLLGSAINTLNQSASYVDQDAIGTDIITVDDLFVDLGFLNVFSTKITGTITGTLATGDTVTGATSAATGKIAFKATTYIELVNVVGTFVAGEAIYETVDVNYITASGVEVLEDVVVTNAAGTTRRAQGTDYDLDPDYGYIRKISGGDIIDTDVVSYDYEAVDKTYIWGMSAGSVEKKLIFVTDKDDLGPRQRWTFHKVKIAMNGEFPLIGDGAAIMQVTGTVLKDTTQISGQEYYKVEMM